MKLQDARLEKDSSCPECGSTNIVFDEVFGFYTCTSCTHVWAHDEDDPDYDDDIVDFGDDYPDYKRVTPWS
jgi:transcription initiation factor TFIIIB Brf1 subunit/transcription initiation factor TFIIB